MKRDMDIVRGLLLKIEKYGTVNMGSLMSESPTAGEVNQTNYHLKMLIEEAGMVRGEVCVTMDRASVEWIDLDLTWQGHDFLDSVRDPEIWRLAKDGAQKVGGLSIELLGELAKGLVKQQIKKLTGVEI
ncbi:MAG: DUF2513 domain-containing protein [Devosiaceae bacterium]|nr:DUF2513 domain-containing protein [Devosiaceae bacterium]